MESAIKSEFSSRLREICEDKGLPRGRGLAAALVREMKALKEPILISVAGVTKWLNGEGMPELEKAIALANWAGVNVTWLLQGAEPKRGSQVDVSSLVLRDAIDDLPPSGSQATFDFIQFQLVQADGFIAPEKLARYMKLIDNIKKNPPK